MRHEVVVNAVAPVPLSVQRPTAGVFALRVLTLWSLHAQTPAQMIFVTTTLFLCRLQLWSSEVGCWKYHAAYLLVLSAVEGSLVVVVRASVFFRRSF
jgi:hypothetical protein